MGHVYMILIGWLQHELSAQRQSDKWQAALTDYLTDVDTVLVPIQSGMKHAIWQEADFAR